MKYYSVYGNSHSHNTQCNSNNIRNHNIATLKELAGVG